MEKRRGLLLVLIELFAMIACFPCSSLSLAQLADASINCASSDYKLSPGRVPCLPNLELMVPLPIDDGVADDAWREFTDIFFFSLRLFWPLDKTRLLIVTPSNRPEAARQTLVDGVRAATKEAHLASGRVAFHVAPKGQEDEKGWDRQQRFMFFSEYFTSAEFVGFCDSDTVFTGVVQEQDLFDELRRPRIIGLYGRPTHDEWGPVPNITYFALGMPEPFRHMDQFPVIVRTAHLKEIREHIARHLGTKDFDEAFSLIRDMGRPLYSQFGIMTTYLWYKRRDEYSWHIQEFERGWKGKAPLGQVPNTPETMATLRPYLNDPLPRIAVHWKYEGQLPTLTKAGWIIQNNNYLHLMRDAVCYSMPLGLPPAGLPRFCHGLNLTGYYRWQWVFERHDWSWHPCVPLASRLRRERAVKSAWPNELMLRILKFDLAHRHSTGVPVGLLPVGYDKNKWGPKPRPVPAPGPVVDGQVRFKTHRVLSGRSRAAHLPGGNLTLPRGKSMGRSESKRHGKKKLIV
eukprot:jgi/Mesvir1/23167/Mv22640-RA.1